MPVIVAPTEPTHEAGPVRFTALARPSTGSNDTSVWRVEVPPNTPGVPHSLTREEVFVVLSGRAAVRIDGEEAVAGPGDAIVVPAGVEFALANSGAEPLHAVVCLPVGGQARMDGGEPFTPPWAE